MRKLMVALVVILWSLTARAELPTHGFTLDNGLKVLIREDHRAPVVTVMVWFKAGSFDEAPYETGLAHELEHMMFKGSEKAGPAKVRADSVPQLVGKRHPFNHIDSGVEEVNVRLQDIGVSTSELMMLFE